MNTILFLPFINYIFIKKNGKYIFKIYGNILIGYRYLDSKILIQSSIGNFRHKIEVKISDIFK